MGIFGKSKKQKEKEEAELKALNDQLVNLPKEAAKNDTDKKDAIKKQEEYQAEIQQTRAAFDAKEDAFNAEKAKYDAEMLKLADHNKEIAKLEDHKKKVAAAKAALEEVERLLQEEKDQEAKDAKDNSQEEADAAARLTAAKSVLTELHKSKEQRDQQLAMACITGAVAKHEEQYAHEQHERMITDLEECVASIPSAKVRLGEAEDKLKPVLEAHEIARKILEDVRSVAREQEAVEARARAPLTAVQQDLASIEHSKAQKTADLASTEKNRSSRASDLMAVQWEISDLDKRHTCTKQEIQETTQAQQNAEERLETARRRFASQQTALERGMAEKQELEAKVDNAEEDLRTAKAARERSESLLESLKAEMTAKITELTWVQKECSELRIMSSKSLKELTTFVDNRNADLIAYRANQSGSKQEAITSAWERQRVQQKETTNSAAMNLVGSQAVRNNDKLV